MGSIFKKALFIVITGSLIISLSKSIFSYKDKLSFYQETREDFIEVEKENKSLKIEQKKEADYYRKEEQMRERLNRLKPNEVAIIVPPITLTPTPTPIIVKKPHEQWRDLLVR